MKIIRPSAPAILSRRGFIIGASAAAASASLLRPNYALAAGQIQRLNRGQVKPYNSIPRIDWSHPLAQNLSLYLYDIGGSIIDLVNGGQIKTVGASGSQVSQFGRALKFPLTGFGFMPPLLPSKLPSLGQVSPYSFSAATYFTGGVGPASPDGAFVSVQDANNSEATQFGMNVYPSFPALGDVTGFVFDDTSSGFIPMQSTSILQGVFQTWGTSVPTSSFATLYANGHVDSTFTGSTNSPPGHVVTPQIMYNTARADFQDFGNAINGYSYYSGMWGGRALAATDHFQLHHDPWQFLIYPEDEMFATLVGGITPLGGITRRSLTGVGN